MNGHSVSSPGPAGPCDPARPVAPAVPAGPGGPASPAGPAGPVAPTGPLGPAGPCAPAGPGGPASPWEPADPGSPCGPAARRVRAIRDRLAIRPVPECRALRRLPARREARGSGGPRRPGRSRSAGGPSGPAGPVAPGGPGVPSTLTGAPSNRHRPNSSCTCSPLWRWTPVAAKRASSWLRVRPLSPAALSRPMIRPSGPAGVSSSGSSDGVVTSVINVGSPPTRNASRSALAAVNTRRSAPASAGTGSPAIVSIDSRVPFAAKATPGFSVTVLSASVARSPQAMRPRPTAQRRSKTASRRRSCRCAMCSVVTRRPSTKTVRASSAIAVPPSAGCHQIDLGECDRHRRESGHGERSGGGRRRYADADSGLARRDFDRLQPRIEPHRRDRRDLAG